MKHTQFEPDEARFSLLGAILAWLWPGLGHISLGEKKRGLYIMIGVLFLFTCGILVGGIDAVDRQSGSDRLWFYAQGLCGPIAFAADFVNQNYVKQLPASDQLRTQGLGRVNEMGTLFVALAGLMNLIVILDALHFIPRRQVETGSETGAAGDAREPGVLDEAGVPAGDEGA